MPFDPLRASKEFETLLHESELEYHVDNRIANLKARNLKGTIPENALSEATETIHMLQEEIEKMKKEAESAEKDWMRTLKAERFSNDTVLKDKDDRINELAERVIFLATFKSQNQ